MNSPDVKTPHGEREAWLDVVHPADLDGHMASVGQAEANAAIVKEMFVRHPLAENEKLLIHGCGTCQMFDYVDLSIFGKSDITFADLSPRMLEVARKRLERFAHSSHKIAVDDIERSNLNDRYDAALLVLVLLHVNWKKALENIIRLGVSSLYIIEQAQRGTFSMTPTAQLLPSMQRYQEVASPVLVSPDDLSDFLGRKGIKRMWTTEHRVPGNKSMLGFIFSAG
jgi:SAM-dependent methyltransferase